MILVEPKLGFIRGSRLDPAGPSFASAIDRSLRVDQNCDATPEAQFSRKQIDE